jgi:hypothetical protein
MPHRPRPDKHRRDIPDWASGDKLDQWLARLELQTGRIAKRRLPEADLEYVRQLLEEYPTEWLARELAWHLEATNGS